MPSLKLNDVMRKGGISDQELADAVTNKRGRTLSRPAISQARNHGKLPLKRCPDFKTQVEAFFKAKNISKTQISTLWESNHNDTPEEEPEMITPTAMKHFGIFRNPIIDDVQASKDVLMSHSHKRAEAAMLDAAKNGGFVAITGECGSGKSVLRRKMISELNEQGDVRIIYPQCIDKLKLTSAMILDSIVQDLDPENKPKRGLEAKARQVRDLLLNSAHAGARHVLILEEAHDLTIPCLKQLKRLWEIEDGFRKVLGIVLIAQTELRYKMNRQTHPEMREVILRCLITDLQPLSMDEVTAYMSLKFKKAGKSLVSLFEPEAISALCEKLTRRNTKGESIEVRTYPLEINNLMIRAINKAADAGEPVVTSEVIKGS